MPRGVALPGMKIEEEDENEDEDDSRFGVVNEAFRREPGSE
jgi:hypothetical protein